MRPGQRLRFGGILLRLNVPHNALEQHSEQRAQY
jgi:hypothetical protein